MENGSGNESGSDTALVARQSVAVLHPDLTVRSAIIQWLEEAEIEVPKSGDGMEALDHVNLALLAGVAPEEAASIVTTAMQRNQPPAIIVIVNDMVLAGARRLRETAAGNDTLADLLAVLAWTRT